MHIMQIVSGTSAMNGAMVHCVQLCERLAARGHRVKLVCRPSSKVLDYVGALPIEVITSPQHRWPTDELRRVADVIRQQQVDVVHAHMSRSQFFGVLLKHMTGVPCVATAHCQAVKAHRPFNDFVIANSEANRRTQMWKNLVWPGKIETVYCPIDLAGHGPLDEVSRRAVRQTLGADDQSPLLGVVGSICRRKGHDILLKALPEVLRRHGQVRVAFVGQPFEREAASFHRLAERLGVGHAIEWTGFRKDIPQVMSALDICLVPSRAEPFGLTAVEALAAGTPVIASRVGGLPETVDHQQTGLLVRPRNPAALAAAIDRLLSDDALHARLSHNAREAMRQRYDPERLWTRIEQILLETASRRTPSRALAMQ